jgi:hypothetical protein
MRRKQPRSKYVTHFTLRSGCSCVEVDKRRRRGALHLSSVRLDPPAPTLELL